MRVEFFQNLVDTLRRRNQKRSLRHKKYGKIYLPLYDLNTELSDIEPEVYNDAGERMHSFFFRDFCFASQPFQQSRYFLLDRYNFGLKTHLYSHEAMLRTTGRPDRRYGLLIESHGIVPRDYLIFDKHPGLEKDFDAVFSYDARILDRVANAKFFPSCAGVWYGSERGGGELSDQAYEAKDKNVSIISSAKVGCELHKLRIRLAKVCKREALADTFGTFDGGNMVKTAETLTRYRYSIAIENDITPYFFTEKITNCFAAMTVPVYLGAEKIDEFFNPDGIIKIRPEDIENIGDILKECGEKDYQSRLPAIIDNYQRVQKYLNIWDYLYTEYLGKELGNVKSLL